MKRIPNFGWNRLKLAALTYEQINTLEEQVKSEHACKDGIHMYDKAGRDKLDALSWAVQQAEAGGQMSTNKQALREAAEKATPGSWWIDSHGQAMVSFIDNDVLEVFATDNKRAAVRHEDTGNLSRWRNDNDATFIAAANPATVLALLDELEAEQNRNAELSSAVIAPGVIRCAGCGFVLTKNNISMSAGTITAGDSKTEPCPNGCGPLWPVTWKEQAIQFRDDSEQWFEELQSARKKIAELEEQDSPKFVQCWSCKHDIEISAIADCDGYCPRCAAPIDLDDEPYAGITVKGNDMTDQLKIRAEDVEPGDVVITFHGKRYTVKSFWMEDDIVTLFGTDGLKLNTTTTTRSTWRGANP